MLSVEFISQNSFIITGQTIERGEKYKYNVYNGKTCFEFISVQTPETRNKRLFVRGKSHNGDFFKLNIVYLNISKKDFLECIDLLNSGNYEKEYYE